MVDKLVFMALLACTVLSAGCICPAFDGGGAADGNGPGTADLDSGNEVVGGGEVVIGQENGGMSDPSKCNNLPPQQMADCLQHSIGG